MDLMTGTMSYFHCTSSIQLRVQSTVTLPESLLSANISKAGVLSYEPHWSHMVFTQLSGGYRRGLRSHGHAAGTVTRQWGPRIQR